MRLEYVSTTFRAISCLDASENWDAAAVSTFDRLWNILSADDDAHLSVDRSHMSLEGQRAQRVFEDYSAAFAPPSDVDAAMVASAGELSALLRQLVTAVKTRVDIASELTIELEQQVEQLFGKVVTTTDSKQRSRCCVLCDVLCRTMRAMINDEEKLTMAPPAMQQWAEANKHCLSRWESEIFSMHDWVCGQRVCVQSRHAEDIVLKILHDHRAQLAEGMLNSLKSILNVADEVHFENYFYSALRLGVQAQTRGEADPSRMNYMHMQTFDIDAARAAFARVYTPSHIRSVLRTAIFEASNCAETREKVYDWLRGSIPVGFHDDLDSGERQAKWLHEMCHDSDYRITDAALSFMLCRMHVLAFDASLLCPSASRLLGCGTARLHHASDDSDDSGSSSSRGLFRDACNVS
jgi:hypothetical protein